MIDLTKIDIFNNNISTLKETSHDTTGECFMTNSKKDVIDFDKVKEDYLLQFEKNFKVLCSNDALLINATDKATFIEFKNGNLKRDTKNLREKITHSLLIFTDITQTTVSFTRENLNYILVYNESKNQDISTMQSSQNRTKIASSVSKLGNKKLIRFNLEYCEKLFFNKVFTYTETEFEDNFVENLHSIRL